MSLRYKGGVISATAPTTSTSTATGAWTRQSMLQAVGASTWPRSPGAPTIGTATAAGPTSASVTFTAPSDIGSSAITSYTVTSSPGGLTATGAASPITVTGLTTNIAYTFIVTATNGAGTGPSSAASNSVTPTQIGGNIGPSYAVPDSLIYSTVTGLSSSAILVCYREYSTGYYMARVGSISGTSISYGSNTRISTISPQFRPTSCTLTSTLGLTAWCDGSNSYIAAMTVSGTTVTVGTPVTTGYYTQQALSLCQLTSTTALAVFRDINNNLMKSFVVTVSGTTVSLGTAISFGSQGNVGRVSAFSSTLAMAVWGGNTTYINALPLTVSGTTVTAGTNVTNNNLGVTNGYTASVNSSYIVESASSSNGSTSASVRLVDTSGNPQTVYSITNSDSSQGMVSCPDGTNIQAFYTQYASPYNTNVTFLSVSGTSLVAQSGTTTQTVSDSVGWYYGDTCTISSTKTAFSYQNNVSGTTDQTSVAIIY